MAKSKTLKTPAKKQTVSQKTTPAKQIETLRARIEDIQNKLKRSDAQTRKNITALEKSFAVLQKRAGGETPELKSQIAKLSQKIESMGTSAREDVNAALGDALTHPSTGKITEALTRAEQRLVAAETAQSASISKVNRHIADMAMAIDARFKKDARTSALAVSELGQRISSVESQSATAISDLGDKMIAISTQYGQRAQDSEEIIKEKVSEIALKTQEEFEQYRATLERRIETLASQQEQVKASLDTTVLGLSSRVEGLEHVAGAAAAFAIDPNANVPAYAPEPQNLTPQDENEAAPLIDSFDAFAPEPTQNMAAQDVPQNPYAVPEPLGVLDDLELDETAAHIPQEFNPAKTSATNVLQGEFSSAQIPAPIPAPAPALVPLPTPIPAPASLDIPARAPAIATSALMSENQGQQSVRSAYYDTPEPLPLPTSAPELSLPYADPAYAETPAVYEPGMDQARPGDFGAEKKRLALPNISLSPRNMKVAGLALGVAVIGLVGAKVLMGGSGDTTLNAGNSLNRNLDSAIEQPVSLASNTVNTAGIDASVPTIGQYADNQVHAAAPGSTEAVTLEAAADAGDSIAQYQLGVSYLENGRMEDAVSLIRSAADKGQPAAQYRLAKLYETGEGVAQNESMARQLTERAARSGNRIAMHDLALYHAEGRGGVKMDLDIAAKWFEKAAERGVVDSQFNLGVMYETGKGVPKNLTDAYVWYSIAAAQGDQFAKERVSVLESQLDAPVLTAATSRAKKFTPAKIDQGANGIFQNLPWSAQREAAAAPASQADPRIKDVQVMLTGLGFDTGGVDGSIGPKTRTAIVSFQQANGLPETGQVDEALVDRLEFASGA